MFSGVMSATRAGRVLEAVGRSIRRDVIDTIAAQKDALVEALFGRRPIKRIKLTNAEVRET